MAQPGSKLVGGVPAGAAFRYYIHDGVEEFRLQLIGALQESRVPELVGCWTTARSILTTRRLVLDVSSLRTIDEAGREWLLSMVREGATTIPNDYFRTHLCQPEAGIVPEPIHVRATRLGRLLNPFRGHRERELPAGTSPRAR